MKLLFLLIIIQKDILSTRAIIGLDSLTQVDNILKKPYKTYLYNTHEPSTTLSTSTTTGTPKPHVHCPLIKFKGSECECNLQAKYVRCRNLNNTFPVFTLRPYSMSALTNNTTDCIDDWHFDLKWNSFKNISILYETFYQFQAISTIDLSNADDGASQMPSSNQIEYLYLNSSGLANTRLHIHNLNLKANRIKFLNLTTTKQITVHVLDLSMNDIGYLRSDMKLCYLHLRILNLSNNRLDAINLNEYLYLDTLDLSNNTIDKINYTSVLKNDCELVVNLKHLNMSNNNLASVELTSFLFRNTIVQVDLSHNRLDRFNLDDLVKLKNLTVIKLNRNQIERLLFSMQVHETIESLVYLDLSRNNLHYVKDFTFGRMKNLLYLDLSSNQIKSIEPSAFMIHPYAYHGPGVLEKLDLSNNQLQHLDNRLFVYLTNLRYLKLASNHIRHLNPVLFQYNRHLQAIDLANNYLDNLNFTRHLRPVKYIKLVSNRLVALRNADVFHLKSIRHIDVSFNQISMIGNCTFYLIHKTINKFLLNNNQLGSISSCLFQQYEFKAKRFVEMAHNPINCTNSCDLLNSVRNEPHAVAYYGNECKYFNSNYFCTNADYERLNRYCQTWQHYCLNTFFDHIHSSGPVDSNDDNSNHTDDYDDDNSYYMHTDNGNQKFFMKHKNRITENTLSMKNHGLCNFRFGSNVFPLIFSIFVVFLFEWFFFTNSNKPVIHTK